jgi:hypothetical protein
VATTAWGCASIEANVALQAADVLGYAPAAALYRAALADDLRACSIYGIPASEELRILRGQAAFRLMQTEALSGSVPAAQAVLDELAAADDENPFAAAGAQWLAAFPGRGRSGRRLCRRADHLRPRDHHLASDRPLRHRPSPARAGGDVFCPACEE